MILFINHTVTPYWIAFCSHVSPIHTFSSYFLLYIKVLMATAMFVGFEVLTAVVMKIYIFWDTTLCSLLKVDWHFPPKYQLTFNGQHGIISQKTEFLNSSVCQNVGKPLTFNVDYSWRSELYIKFEQQKPKDKKLASCHVIWQLERKEIFGYERTHRKSINTNFPGVLQQDLHHKLIENNKNGEIIYWGAS
jgi:hypothetical protein